MQLERKFDLIQIKNAPSLEPQVVHIGPLMGTGGSV